MNNNQTYGNTNMLEEAYTRLNEAMAIRNAYSGGYQIDSNGVSVGTPLSINNAQQAQEITNTTQTQDVSDSFVTRLVGTVDEALRNIGQGFFRIAEGIVDYGIGLVGGIIGEQDWAEDAISFDITNAVYDWTDNYFSPNALYKASTGRNLYDQSFLNDASDKVQTIVRGVEQGLGSSLAAMGLTAIGTAIGAPQLGLALYSVGAAGQTMQETVGSEDYTGDYWGAFGMSTISGAVEGAVEKLSDAFGIGTFAEKVVGKSFGDTLGNLAKAFVAEGMEEVIGDVAEPFYKGIYNKKSVAENFEEDVSMEGLFQSFLIGGVSGAIMQGASASVRNIMYSKEGVKITEEMHNTIEKAKNAKNEFLTSEQTTLEQQQQAKAKYDATMSEVRTEMENYASRIKQLDIKYQNRLSKSQQYDEQFINDIDTTNVEEFAKNIVTAYNLQEGTNYDVVFDSDINDNGYIDIENNEIHLSKNPTKATRQILSHELTHAIKQNNYKGFESFTRDVERTLSKENATTSVKETLKPLFQGVSEDGSTYTDHQALNDYIKANNLGETFNNQYDQRIAYEKAKYGTQLNDAQIREEVVSEYVANNLLKSWNDLSDLFTSKSRIEAFKDTIKGLLSKTKDTKLKEQYKDLFKRLDKITPTQQFEEMAIKASKKDEATKDTITKEELTTKLNDAFKEANKHSDTQITFSHSDFLDTIDVLLKKANISQEAYTKEVSKLNSKILSALRFNGETLSEYIKSQNSDMTLSEAKEVLNPIIEDAVNDMATETKQGTTTLKTSSIVEYVRQTINAFRKDINMLLNVNSRSRNATLKLVRNKQFFKDIVSDSKQFKNIDSQTTAIANQMSKIGFTGKGKINYEARNVLLSSKTSIFENPMYRDFNSIANLDSDYYNQAFDYLQDRINEFNEKGYKKIPGLETNFSIDEYFADKYPLLEGKTEAELAVDIENQIKRIIKEASNRYGILDGREVDVKKVAQEEAVYQDTIHRKEKALKGKVFWAMSQIMDTQAYLNIMAGGSNNSLFNKMYSQLQASRNKTSSIKTDLLTELNDYVGSNKKLIGNLKRKKVNLLGRDITLGDAISLYLTTETDNAISHLVGEGVTINNDSGRPAIITGKEFLTNFLDADTLQEYSQLNEVKSKNEVVKERISDIKVEAINNLQSYLNEQIGADYKELMKIIRNMYKKSGRYYQEASEAMNGFSYALKENFYPTKSNVYAFIREVGSLDANANFVQDNFNPSFTKKLVQGASNSLQISDVLTTANAFIRATSTYAGITVEVKNLERFLSSKVVTTKAGRKMSLYEYMSNYVDPNFTSYMSNLFKTMQGIRTTKYTPFNNWMGKIRGAFAKSALAYNVKAILSQFTSFPMAGTYISSSSLLKSFGSKKGLKDFNFLMENSPLIQERYRNNNLYNAEAVGAINGTMSSIVEAGMKPYQVTDKRMVAQIWYAAQIETNGNIEEAINLLERTVESTQQQPDALGSAPIARTDNELIKSFAMFASDARKQFSRIAEAAYNLLVSKNASVETKAKAKKQFARTISSYMITTLLMASLTTALQSLKGDYDDKEKEEIAKDILLNNLGSNYVGAFPIVKEIYNYFTEGYDITVTGVQQINDALDALSNQLPKIVSTTTSGNEKFAAFYKIFVSIGSLCGIPARNLYNDFSYIFGTVDKFFDTNLILKMKNIFYDTSDNQLTTLMKTYKNKGSESQVEAVMEMKFDKYINGAKPNEKAIKELARLYTNDSLKTLPSKIDDKLTINGNTITLNKAQKSQAQAIYQLANDILLDMVNSSYYANLNDEEKANAISKLYSLYYDNAKNVIDSEYELNKFSYVAPYVDSGRFIVALSQLSNIKADDKQSRKTKVSNYINSLRMNRSEKYLLYYLSGYNLDDNTSKMVISYLRQQGMSYKEAQEYLNA